MELGNQTLFLDIYTWHQLQIDNPESIAYCQASDNFPPNDYIKEGFAKTQGTEEEQWESLVDLAIHEQLNVLGQVIYRDEGFRDQLDRNEFFGGAPCTSPAQAGLSSDCDESRDDRVNVFSDSTALFGRDYLWDDNQRINWIAGVDANGNPTEYTGNIADHWRGTYTPQVRDGSTIILGPHGPEVHPNYRDGEPITEEERQEIIRDILNNP